MAALGPFEPAPHLAVAVSGGPDSLALMALTADWLRGVGGRGTVLTVDHRLRAASSAEARWVATLAHDLGLAHRTLVWTPQGRTSEAAAREARYAMLDAACREVGALHLLVGHHADDQAVTRAMRARRAPGAGVGLAGMAMVRELRHARVLRPLLGVPRAQLLATARALGRGWIEDPSNRDPRFERNRTAGLDDDGSVGAWRRAVERDLATTLALRVRADGLGGLVVAVGPDPAPHASVLRAAIGTVGGRRYWPSPAAVAALATVLSRGTLGGTVIERRGDGLHLYREWAQVRPIVLAPDDEAAFDGRFRLCHRGPAPLRIEALGAAAAKRCARGLGGDWRVLAGLPSVDGRPLLPAAAGEVGCRWRPRLPLASTPFAAALVVSRSGLPT